MTCVKPQISMNPGRAFGSLKTAVHCLFPFLLFDIPLSNILVRRNTYSLLDDRTVFYSAVRFPVLTGSGCRIQRRVNPTAR